MVIEHKKVVSVNYILTANQELIEQTSSEKPFVFLVGSGGLLEEFESNLKGLRVGDAFDFKIKAENAYGVVHADHIVAVPLEAFKDKDGNIDEDMVLEGNVLPMVDGEGNQIEGMVVKVETDTVTMDFNHPLAGKDLSFKGQVLDIRNASAEEMDHGHVHGPHGHHH